MEEITIKLKFKLRLYYYVCLAKHEFLKVVSKERALKYCDKWTKDINENDSKYFKVISKR